MKFGKFEDICAFWYMLFLNMCNLFDRSYWIICGCRFEWMYSNTKLTFEDELILYFIPKHLWKSCKLLNAGKLRLKTRQSFFSRNLLINNIFNTVALPAISVGLVAMSLNKKNLPKQFRNNPLENVVLIGAVCLAIYGAIKIVMGFFA